jgi:type I restriction enzyme, S subunit
MKMNKVRLGDMLTFQRGYDLTHSQMENGKIPVVGSSEIIGWHNKANVKAPALLIGRSGTVGRPQYYETDIWAHNTTLFVSDYHDNDPKFCFYFLKKLNLEDYANSSGVPTLNRNSIHPLIVNFPDRPTQTAIVCILSSFDDKIELNNKINNELENLAKTIYDYWFVQNKNKKWEKVKLQKIGVNVIRGVTYNKNDIKTANDKNVVGILRATNINGNIIDLDDLVYIDKSLISENQKLQLFDILITMSSGSKEHVGKNGLFCFDNANVAFGAFCSKIDVEEEYKFYIYEHFQSEKFKNYVKSCCLGTNINNLNNEIIKDISITMPPTPILQKFNKTVSPIFSDIIKNQQENACLVQLRDFLLPLLMNGQVKVKNG